MKRRGTYRRSARVRWTTAVIAAASLAGYLASARVGLIWMPSASGGVSATLSRGVLGLYADAKPNEKFGSGLSELPAETGLDFEFDYDSTPRPRMDIALWPLPPAAGVLAWWAWRRRRVGECAGCGYALVGLPACPECGAAGG